MANIKSILDITTLHTEPKFVTIDGTPYELIPQQRLKFGDVRFILHAHQGMGKLLSTNQPARDEEYAAATDNMVRCVRTILAAPKAVIVKLSAAQQLDVVNAWVAERDADTPKKKTKSKKKGSRIRSRKRSLASNGSMGAPPKAG